MSKQTNDFQKLITMIMELLVDGEVVESKEFPDPDTGSQREVDVYALVRGKTADGQQIKIAVECVDRAKKSDAPWVEMIHGKHCRLQVADIVSLVSKTGFYSPAEKKARTFGYHTIHPAISPRTLTKKLGLAGDLKMSAKMPLWDMSPPSVTSPIFATDGYRWDDAEWFLRADGSKLVTVADYQGQTLIQDLQKNDPSVLLAQEASERPPRTITVEGPTYNGEQLFVIAHSLFDQPPVVAIVEEVSFTAKGESSDRADFEQTHPGTFDGLQIGTGVSTLDGKPARMVVAEDSEGGMKAQAKWQYEVK